MLTPTTPAGRVEFELEDERRVIVRDMLTITRATDQFLGDCIRRGHSQRTVDTYQRLLDKLADSCPLDYDVGQVTEDHVRRFLDGFNRKSAGTRAHAFSVLSSFFKWLDMNEKVKRNPMQRLARPKRHAPEDLDVVTVSAEDVRRLLEHARPGSERIALYILAYLGPRRAAVSRLRLRDYDQLRQRMRFFEKGGKVNWKPVPAKLASVLQTELAALELAPDDYLVPNEGPRNRTGERDDRVIWRLVKGVADRAGVEAHVHALRAAFAVHYLETTPGADALSLQDLLMHRSIQTTQVYLRKRSKERGMEPVRALDWGDNTDGAGIVQFPAAGLESSR